MNVRNKNVRKTVAYISAVFCFSTLTGLAQAQQKPPTQKDFDAMNAALKKMPTPQQDAYLSKISDSYQKKYEPLHAEFERLGEEIDRATEGESFLLTKAHVLAATVNHKKLRVLYEEHINAIADWGRRSGRIDCVRQADKTKLYMIRISDQWLTKVAALPLGTVEDRLYAGQHVMGGGGDETFHLGQEPSGDIKNWVDAELIGLYAVCGGGREEYMPGTE